MATQCLFIPSAAMHSTARPAGRARLITSPKLSPARLPNRRSLTPTTALFGFRRQPESKGNASVAEMPAPATPKTSSENGDGGEAGSYLSGRLQEVRPKQAH